MLNYPWNLYVLCQYVSLLVLPLRRYLLYATCAQSLHFPWCTVNLHLFQGPRLVVGCAVSRLTIQPSLTAHTALYSKLPPYHAHHPSCLIRATSTYLLFSADIPRTMSSLPSISTMATSHMRGNLKLQLASNMT